MNPYPEGEQNILKLDQNERSEGAPDWALDALAGLEGQELWRYPDRSRFEHALSQFHGLDPDQLLLTNGSDEAILYFLANQPSATSLHIPLPSFSLYTEQIRHWPINAHLIPPRADLSLDLSATRACIAQNPGGWLILVQPNNPTGEYLGHDALRDMLQFCRRHKTRMLLDEAYVEFGHASFVTDLNRHPNLLILRTFSKAYGLAGLRLGYLVGSVDLIGPIRARSMPYNVSSASLKIAHAALQPAAQDDVGKYTDTIAANRDEIYTCLRQWNVDVNPSQANFLLLRLGTLRAELLTRFLRSEGISTRVFTRDELKGCVRISIPSRHQRLKSLLHQVLAPELICLDVDGCLVDTRASFDAVVKDTFAFFANRSLDEQEIRSLRLEGGYNDDWVLTWELLKRDGHDLTLTRVAEKATSLYLGTGSEWGYQRHEKAMISESVALTLNRKAKLALVTGRNREELAHALKLLKSIDIAVISSSDDVQRGKPDPEGILRAKNQLALSHAWMVGDNVDDMKAARAAGAIAVGVGANRDALEAAGAHMVIDRIDRIGELV